MRGADASREAASIRAARSSAQERVGELIDDRLRRRRSETHPDYERVKHFVRTRMGQATDCWLVARGPAMQLSTPSERTHGLGLAVWGRRVSVLTIFCVLAGLLMVLLTVTGTAHLLGGLALTAAMFATPVVARRLLPHAG